MRRTLALLVLLAMASLWIGCAGADNTNGTNANITVQNANITVVNPGANTNPASTPRNVNAPPAVPANANAANANHANANHANANGANANTRNANLTNTRNRNTE